MEKAWEKLRRSDMSVDPIDQFKRWYDRAVAAAVPLPNGASLATVNDENKPTNRMVMVQLLEKEGFLFYSNYESDKGESIRTNPNGALLFWWGALNWQIRIEGEIDRFEERLVDQYFGSRPREAQLGARVSPQSKVVVNRAVLEKGLEKERIIWEGREIARPAHWGGYLLRANRVEFWQQGVDRLHDRFLYRLEEGVWQLDRLAP